jgi:predicted dehydrogenase
MNESPPVPIVVIGAGHLGRFHIAKLVADPAARLLGAVEVDPARAQVIGAEFKIRCEASLEAFLPEVHAAVIAAPTLHHHALALHALAHGLDILIEKPIASTEEQAREIIALAAEKGCLVQVGHTERFNPAVAAALAIADAPRYITTERLGPFSGRSTDIDVVLDLLIHDLDIVSSLVSSPLRSVSAVGVPILTEETDMCSARLEFDNGVVAEMKAGRASLEPSRKIRLITEERYVSIDCGARNVKSVRRVVDGGGGTQIQGEPVEVAEGDALALQDAAFLSCVQTRSTPTVCGEAGLRALELANAVNAVMTTPCARA